MVIEKETNFEQHKIRFCVEATVEEVWETLHGLNPYAKRPKDDSFDLIPDAILLQLIVYFMEKKIKKNEKPLLRY